MNSKQIEALVDLIYRSLISSPEMGLGEMATAREEAERIVSQWIKENNVKIDL